MTQVQSEEIIGFAVLGEMPVEDFLKAVELLAQPLAQHGGGFQIIPLRLSEVRELIAKVVDLLGNVGVFEEQAVEDIVHKRQLLYTRYVLVIINEFVTRAKALEVAMEKFSERLRELRKERGLKQKEMAEVCGIKVRSYQQYEYDENYPTVLGLLFLADYFGVSLDYLMGRKDERN